MRGPEIADAIPPEANLTLKPPRFDFVPGKPIAIRAHAAAMLDVTCARAHWLYLATAGRIAQFMLHHKGLLSIPRSAVGARSTTIAESMATNGHRDQAPASRGDTPAMTQSEPLFQQYGSMSDTDQR